MEARKAMALATAVATLLWVASAVAQTTQQPVQPRQGGVQAGQQGGQQTGQQQSGQQRYQANRAMTEASGAGSRGGADAELAQCLIAPNQGEITLGKLAEQRTKDKDVKQFAERMVKDHSDFLQQVERFAGNRSGQTGLTGATAAHSAPDRSAMPGAAATSTQPAGGQELNWASIQEQIDQRSNDMLQKDLSEKDGSQFDKCYIGSQIPVHMHVLATLEVFRNQASPEFAQVLDKGIETTKSHLEEAQMVARALESQASSTKN